jgi:hypothetical protein
MSGSKNWGGREESNIVHTLLKPQWTVSERASTLLVEAGFQLIDTERDHRGKFGKQQLHQVASSCFKKQLGISNFHFYESRIQFSPVYPLDKALTTFPGWLRLAEAWSMSRPGKARRYAVKSLDTDLHRLGT